MVYLLYQTLLWNLYVTFKIFWVCIYVHVTTFVSKLLNLYNPMVSLCLSKAISFIIGDTTHGSVSGSFTEVPSAQACLIGSSNSYSTSPKSSPSCLLKNHTQLNQHTDHSSKLHELLKMNKPCRLQTISYMLKEKLRTSSEKLFSHDWNLIVCREQGGPYPMVESESWAWRILRPGAVRGSGGCGLSLKRSE